MWPTSKAHLLKTAAPDADIAGMSWALLLFLLPLVVFAVLARRVIRVGRRLRDPEQLRSLLSDDVCAALLDAGLDPDSVSIQEIQKSEKLMRLVAADLRRVLRTEVLGLGASDSHVSTRAARLPLDQGEGVPRTQWRTRSSEQAPEPLLPPPIDQHSDSAARAVLVLAVVGLVAIAIVILNAW